ncbi:site-specific integrase, partial [Leuconostoc suionicum]
MTTREEQLYHDYLESERQYSPQTLKAYLTDIAEFENYLHENGGFTKFGEVQTLDVRV